ERTQDETFVPIRGTLILYLGDPPERHEVPVGSIAHVEAGTAQQMVNESGEELLVFVYGAPPERTGADVIDSAVCAVARREAAQSRGEVPARARGARGFRTVGRVDCRPCWCDRPPA